MGLFRRSSSPAVQASAYSGPELAISGGDSSLVWGSVSRWRAMRIPSISRARDLICSAAGSLPIRGYLRTWDPEQLREVEIPVQPEPWFDRPDPNLSRSHMIAWTVDDLMFYSRAYWLVTNRYSTGYPAAFTRLPADQVTIEADLWQANVPVGEHSIYWQGTRLENDRVIVFYSPIQALLETGGTAITRAERLSLAATRFATTPAAFGWLEQTDGEDLTADELTTLADTWAKARDSAAIAALGRGIVWKESGMDPNRLQLVDSLQHSSLELARVANIPPYLIGAETSSMTYQNAQQAREDLILFGAAPYVQAIEETLSGPAVSSRSRVIRFDRSAWISPLGDTNP